MVLGRSMVASLKGKPSQDLKRPLFQRGLILCEDSVTLSRTLGWVRYSYLKSTPRIAAPAIDYCTGSYARIRSGFDSLVPAQRTSRSRCAWKPDLSYPVSAALPLNPCHPAVPWVQDCLGATPDNPAPPTGGLEGFCRMEHPSWDLGPLDVVG